MHTQFESLKYPREFEVCVKTFDNSLELRKHMKKHSFPKMLFGKCQGDKCGLKSKSEDTMELHVGKCRTEDYDCGLCHRIGKFETH